MKMAGRCAAFTLIELLVVLVLVGIVLGMLSLAMGPSPATRARTHAEGVVLALYGARQSALLESRPYGLRVHSDSTRLMRHDPSGWHAVEPAQRLDAGLRWRLQSAGLAVSLPGDHAAPQIVLLSSDEMTPFTLSLEDSQRRWLTISSDGLAEPELNED